MYRCAAQLTARSGARTLALHAPPDGALHAVWGGPLCRRTAGERSWHRRLRFAQCNQTAALQPHAAGSLEQPSAGIVPIVYTHFAATMLKRGGGGCVSELLCPLTSRVVACKFCAEPAAHAASRQVSAEAEDHPATSQIR